MKINKIVRRERKRGKFGCPRNLTKVSIIWAGNNKAKNQTTLTNDVLLTITSAQLKTAGNESHHAFLPCD